jgi:uncharacterized protein YjbI with pentapeptide repeats
MMLASQPSRRRRRLDIAGAFIRRTDLRGGSFVGANLARADATGAIFDGADLRDANLDGTILIGADLGGAKNLTQDQLSQAIVDRTTILPKYIDRDQLDHAASAAE